MKKVLNPALPHDVGLQLMLRCCICDKQVRGFYGQNARGGTCSGRCEREFKAQPAYPGHSEEEFFQRMEAQDAALLSREVQGDQTLST